MNSHRIGYLANIPNIEILLLKQEQPENMIKSKDSILQKVIFSFVGFLPAEKPQLTILVILDDPQKIAGVNRSAAPLFKSVAKAAIRHYGVKNTKRIWRIEKKGFKKESVAQENSTLRALSYRKN